MNTPITYMPIADITIGTRRRTELGDIKALADSIRDHGLLHPIIVDDDGVLIAGGRRLAAMQRLGFEDAPVRRWQTLGEDDRRIVELEENLQRKDLTAYERSRNLVELATVAEQVDRESGEIVTDSVTKSRGRPVVLGSKERVAERIGIPPATVADATKHVAAADSYPVLQSPGWKQYQAMEAAELLNAIPEEDRKPVEALIDQPGIPPRDAIGVLRNIATKPEPERKQIVDLARSDDDRDRSLALTKAAELPPMPDGRSIALQGVVRDLKKCIKAYPADPEVEELKDIVHRIEIVIESINERHAHRDRTAAD